MSLISFIPKLLRRDIPPQVQPTISLCHTTARLPDGWRKAAQAWFDNCDHPENVEHIIATDEPFSPGALPFADTKLVLNKGRHSAVDGWNTSAQHSTGKFLITVADDWFPCPHWDTELLKRIPDLDGEHVLEVNTGGDEGILTFSLLTRKYYDRYGYLFNPRFVGMYADLWFTDVARRDRVVIDCRDLYFEHVHPCYGKGEMDDTHKWQHRPEAFQIGEQVYKELRYLNGFDSIYVPPRSFTVAVCMPGEYFRFDWIGNMLQLIGYLKDRVFVKPILGDARNRDPHITYGAMTKQVLDLSPLPDLVLWIDRNSAVAPVQFAKLFESLKEHPEADGVAAWSWWDNPARISAGFLDGNTFSTISHQQLMAGSEDAKEVDWTGFSVFLMRGETLKKAGPRPFMPIISDEYPWGFSPEDKSFCKHAKENGCRFFIDRRVEVQSRSSEIGSVKPQEAQEHVA